MTMKAERQQKEVMSRVIQPSKGGGGHIVDNRPNSIHQAKMIENIGGDIQYDPQRKPIENKSSSHVNQMMWWTWIGGAWYPDDTTTQNPVPALLGKKNGDRFDDGLDKEVEDVEPPLGYSLVTDSVGRQAYLHNPNDYVVGKVALDHLIDIAHGNENRIHRSAQMTGTLIPTYIHPSDDELYTFTTQDNHIDGIPKITIHEQGKVRGGVHKFGK